jgi:hypothetical protein
VLPIFGAVQVCEGFDGTLVEGRFRGTANNRAFEPLQRHLNYYISLYKQSLNPVPPSNIHFHDYLYTKLSHPLRISQVYYYAYLHIKMSAYLKTAEEPIKMDLQYLGQHEARYVQKQVHIVLQKTNNLLHLFTDGQISSEYLHYWLSKYQGPYTNEQGTAHYIVNTYKEIYETLANRIRHSLRRPLGVPLPALVRWLLGSDGATRERDWRNIIAHNAGVPAPYEWCDEDKIANRRFEPKKFLEEGVPILRELKEDLEMFLGWLDSDVDDYPVLQVEERVYDAFHEQDFLAELLGEGCEDVMRLQEEEERLLKRSGYHQEEADRIENIYLVLAKDMADGLRQQASATEAKMYAVCAQKLARVKEIWNEREAAAAGSDSQWTLSEGSSWSELDEFDWGSAEAQEDTDTEQHSSEGDELPTDYFFESSQLGSIPEQTSTNASQRFISCPLPSTPPQPAVTPSTVQNMVHCPSGRFHIPVLRSWYHLFTGLLVRLRQTTPRGKHVRTRAAQTMSLTPPEPCEDVKTANLSRYGTQSGESEVSDCGAEEVKKSC